MGSFRRMLTPSSTPRKAPATPKGAPKPDSKKEDPKKEPEPILTGEQAGAASKLQAAQRGKNVRIQEEQRKEAAVKIQKLKRGHTVRVQQGQRSLDERVKPALTKKPSARNLQRRVSFGSEQFAKLSLPTLPPVHQQVADAVTDWFASVSASLSNITGQQTAETEPDVAADPDSKLAAAVTKNEVRETDPKPKKLLSENLRSKAMKLFQTIDENSDGTVTFDEAQRFWKNNGMFAGINARAMFNEVDEDGDDQVGEQAWIEFWENVLASGYTEVRG